MDDLISRQVTRGDRMSLRKEQCNKVCHILDDVLANRPTERDSLILGVRKAFEAFDLLRNSEPLPSAQPVIHCWECIYYDPEHIEKKGVRYEYEDMPKDAFDILGTGLVNSEYGINVGGRCCRDYNVGYSEDKRVFVSKQNYCGRAERRTDG